MNGMDIIAAVQEAIDNALRTKLNGFETCLPATIKNVRNDGKVDVVCDIRKIVLNGIVDASDTIVSGVPLLQTGYKRYSIEYELSEGDSVLLLFFSRDSLEWKKRKWSLSDPKQTSANDLNNCVAVPMVKSNNGNLRIVKFFKDGSIEVKNGKCNLKITENGELNFSGVKAKFDCPIECTQKITSSVDVVGGGVSLNKHTHLFAGEVVGTTASGTTNAPSPMPST